MTIRKMIQAGTGLLAAIVLTGALIATYSINQIRIGGPMFEEMMMDQELIADLLPPPLFVVEPFMTAGEIRADGAKPELIADLKNQHKIYNERIERWKASTIDPDVVKALQTSAGASGFWRELETRFIPAAQRGDQAAMDASYGRLDAEFRNHRRNVVELMKTIDKEVAADRVASEGDVSTALAMLMLVGLAIFGTTAYAAWHLTTRVVQPMGELVSVTNELAAGANRAVPLTTRQDELGELSRAVDTFRQAGVDRQMADAQTREEQALVTKALDASLAALKDGDLTHDITERFPPAFAQLRENFNQAIGGIRELMKQVSVSSASILTGADEISTATNTLARRTESNAASLEETNAALGGVESRIRATTIATRTTLGQAGEARTSVNEGRQRASGAVEAMNQVSETTKGIDSVIEGLDKIAFQTRVLAMNAAVEAGRAGEAGRGFAVVADLVSALAMRAEEEARLAREQLTVTQSGIFTAVAAVKEVDSSLSTISTTVEEFHRLLVGIAADNEAQTSALGEISSAVSAMDSATQENAAMVEETSAATTSLAQEVEKLSEQAMRFRVDKAGRSDSIVVRTSRNGASEAERYSPRTPAWQTSSSYGQGRTGISGHA